MSSSSKINFSEIEKPGAEDYNDQGALNKALGMLTFKQPETFGGQFKDPAKKKTIYEQFNTHTPPDITAKTRIIGVSGVLQEAAHPQADGWFVSDFFAFWHLFSGTTEHQTWMHCLDLENLVTKHTRYLHGNPYKERKVVLDAEILDKALKSKHPPVPLKPAGFRAKVVQKIREQCALSRIGKENVLILLFGHGHYKTHGIWLGGGESTDNPSTKVLKLDELQKAIKDTATKVTLLTTHCFSGGWTCNPAVNITAMTAAGHVQESFSWRGSGSSGRYCGSMFATVVIEKLTRYGNDSRKLGESSTVDDEEEEPTEEQMETYSAFSKSVYQTLLEDVDRRGYAHEMSFGAQDDAWEMCWRERTGIPLARFEQRWRCLQPWPADQTLLAGDPQNRDPRVTQEAKDEYGRRLKEAREGKVQYAAKKAHEASGGVLGKRKTSALFGGTDESLVRVVSSLGTQYLASYGPADDSGTDGGLSNTIQRIRSGTERDMGRVQRALTAIEYRMETMATADRYLQIMQIERPRGQRCFEYDARNLRGRVDSKRYDALKALLCDREILFPEPMEDQGQPFFKGIEYLIAAFTAADCAKIVVIKKLDALASILDGELEVEKEVVKRDPEVVSKRRKLFHAFGIFNPLYGEKVGYNARQISEGAESSQEKPEQLWRYGKELQEDEAADKEAQIPAVKHAGTGGADNFVDNSRKVEGAANADARFTYKYYGLFFAPFEFLHTLNDQGQATGANNGIDTERNSVTVPREADNLPTASPADTDDEVDRSTWSFPWQIPRLVLIEASPPSSGNSTPVIEPESARDEDVDELDNV